MKTIDLTPSWEEVLRMAELTGQHALFVELKKIADLADAVNAYLKIGVARVVITVKDGTFWIDPQNDTKTETLDRDEMLKMCARMRTFGGSFARSLSECFILADKENQEKLYAAFPEFINKYGPGSPFSTGEE